jgi:hypothetical protein
VLGAGEEHQRFLALFDLQLQRLRGSLRLQTADRHKDLGAHRHVDEGIGRDLAVLCSDQTALEVVVGDDASDKRWGLGVRSGATWL